MKLFQTVCRFGGFAAICINAVLAIGDFDEAKALDSQVFRVASPTMPESFDPQRVTGITATNIVGNLYEGLTVFDARRFSVVPGVAERWNISQDGKVFTFFLRKGLRWSDGSEVTANDFVFAWRRALSSKTGSPFAYLFYPIQNARGFHQKQIHQSSKLGVRATKKHVLEVKLERAAPYFLELTSLPPFVPLPQRAIKRLNKKWQQPGKMVCNGPFVLQAFEKGKSVVLKKNLKYWEAGKVKLDEIAFFIIGNGREAVARYRAGDIDFTGDIHLSRNDLGTYASSGELSTVPWLATFFLRINCRRFPGSDPKFRLALSLAIDREKVVRNDAIEGSASAYSLVARGFGGYVPKEIERFNPEKARTLFKEMGFCLDGDRNEDGQAQTVCRPLPALEILTNDESSQYTSVLYEIASMWRQHLGLKGVTIESQPWSRYLKTMKSGKFIIARSAWVADYPDPSSFLKLMLTDGGNNHTGWSNPDFDQLVTGSEQQLDRQKRMQLLNQAETMVVEELPILPVYALVKRYLLKPQVRGFYDNGLHRLYAKSIYYESAGVTIRSSKTSGKAGP